MHDLKALCEAWDGTPQQFAQIMTCALQHMDARTLGGMLEVIPSSTIRWASGLAAPLPGVQQAMVSMLKAKAS